MQTICMTIINLSLLVIIIIQSLNISNMKKLGELHKEETKLCNELVSLLK